MQGAASIVVIVFVAVDVDVRVALFMPVVTFILFRLGIYLAFVSEPSNGVVRAGTWIALLEPSHRVCLGLRSLVLLEVCHDQPVC